MPDSEDEDMLQNLPINICSLSAKLPTGMHCIAKIRSSINKYTSRMARPRWAHKFRLQTVQSMVRRWAPHEEKIVGQGMIDIEIGYSQCTDRIKDLMAAFKLVKSWCEQLNDVLLAGFVPVVDRLRPFFEATEQKIGAEVTLLYIYGRFRLTILKTSKIDAAIAEIDLKALAEAQEEWAREIASPTEEPDDDEDEEDDDMSDEGAEETRATPPPKKAARTTKGTKAPKQMPKTLVVIDGYLQRRFNSSAREQAATIVSDALSKKFHKLPGTFYEDPEVLESFILELAGMIVAWGKLFELDADDDYMIFLRDLKCMAECLRADEGDRPAVGLVREGRKRIWAVAREQKAQAEVAKALAKYKAGVAIVQAALDHSRVGLQDEAATTAFDVALNEFENIIEPACNASLAADSADGDAPPLVRDFENFKVFVAAVHSMGKSVICAGNRWSAAAITEKVDMLANTMSNCTVALSMAHWVMLEETKAFLLKFVTPCPGAMTDTRGGEVERTSEQADAAPIPIAPVAIDSSLVALEASMTTSGNPNGSDGNILCMPKAVSDLTAALQYFTPGVKPYKDQLKDAMQGIKQCFELIANRCGHKWAGQNEGSGEDSFKTLSEVSSSNSVGLDITISYLESFAEVASAGDDRTKLITNLEPTSHLCMFCRIHAAHMMDTHRIEFSGALPDGDMQTAKDASKLLDHFVRSYGDLIYQDISDVAIISNLNIVMGNHMDIRTVHESVLQQAPRVSQLRLLLTDKGIATAVPSTPFVWAGDADMNQFQKLDHNVAIESLKTFVEGIQAHHFAIPQVRDSNDEANFLPLQDAFDILKITAKAKYICLTAAFLHTQLIVPASANLAIVREDLCGPITFALKAIMNLITDMDETINSDYAMELEVKGWRLPVSIASYRAWCKLMALWSHNCQTLLCTQMANFLATATEKLQAAIPSWRACFNENGDLVESIAFRMLSDKYSPLVSANNFVHTTLSQMSHSAQMLSIVPP